LGEWLDDIYETQQMIVGTKSMPGEEWVKTRVFGYVVAFLHFNKLFQIPFIIANSVYDIDYKDMFTEFVGEGKTKTGAFSDLIQVFYKHAREMQNGGPEFMSSERWLNIWWPPDEIAFIKAVTEDRLDDFYIDAKDMLYKVFEKNNIKNYDKVISEAILLNKSLIKLPNQTEDIEIRLNSNILDVYNQTLLGKPSMLKFGDFTYFVDRTTETWNSWEDWCEKVVWWSNKKGAYLYDCLVTENKKTIKSKRNKVIRIESEPFGSDARYQ